MTEALRTALCQAVALPAADDGAAPGWIHLLPAGSIGTMDGRGPYRLPSEVDALIARSMDEAGGRLVLDENHATDLAAPKGAPAPARGWIEELQSREDGIWGRVAWTPEGQVLAGEGKAYRYISPVIRHTKDGEVIAICRASLVNRPNLRGLSALHSEGATMEEVLAKLKQMLGLKDDAEQEDIWSSLGAVISAAAAEKAKNAATATALQSVGKAVGLKDDADVTAILGAVTELASAGTKAAGDAITALQQELAVVTTELNGMKGDRARERAEAFVDAAIKEGRVGVKPLREHYISMHAADPSRVEKEIGAMPILGGGPSSPSFIAPAVDKDGKVPLSEADERVIALLGVDKEAYRKQLQASRQTEEAL